jgi:ABC-2 type transport system permease protein
MGYFGQLFTQFPKWLPKIAPFGNIPNITKDAIHWPTLWVMTTLAAAMVIAAFLLYRRRDLQTA